MADDLPLKRFRDAAAFEKWLAAHQDMLGVLIKFAKKDSGLSSVTYDEAVDVALCYGWIDGQTKSIDERYYQQRYTPRRKQSIWSKKNIARVERLIAAGRMTARGLREIEAAKKDGRWDRAYDSPKNMAVPADLIAALEKNKKAKTFFETINKANRFAICFRIETAKKVETRAARIKTIVAMLTRKEVLYPAQAGKRVAGKKKV
jgi:uncharacterized protein YdeI (YjbR/CyaY-like superfamily)